MTVDLKTGLWSSALRGEAGAMDRLLSLEDPRFYDYLIRMTGSVSRADDTLNHVRGEGFSAEIKELGLRASMEQFRTHLYMTGRSYCADIWDADTKDLINPALGEVPQSIHDEPAKSEHLKEGVNPDHLHLDRALRALAPWERETIVLKLRCGFTEEVIDRIMGMATGSAATNYHSAYAYLKSAMPRGSDIESLLESLPTHPLPDLTSHNTQDLHILMHDLKESRTRSFKFGRLFFFLLVIGGAIAYYYRKQIFHK